MPKSACPRLQSALLALPLLLLPVPALAGPEDEPSASDIVAEAVQPAAEAAAEAVQPAGDEESQPEAQMPTALVHQMKSETELPAMQLSLGLVNFVGDLDPIYPEEETYAILPLGHDAVLEVYDLHYDGQELVPLEQPRIIHKMGVNEAYVVRVPSFGGVPATGFCVTVRDRRTCWDTELGGLNEGFLRWSKTKNIE